MALNQTLSAVAQRKAAILEARVLPDSNDRSNGSPDGVGNSLDVPLTVPLKRKTSILSDVREPVTSHAGSKGEKQIRKRSKPEVHAMKQHISASSTPQRAYSPSQPAFDSSEEDEPPASSDTPVLTEASAYQELEAGRLVSVRRPLKITGTIFNPIYGQNLFSISAEQALPIVGRSSVSYVLVLQPGESLLFVGTMQFALLQGTVELMGSLLSPSKTLHRVFSPRLHPIPTISAPLTHKSMSTGSDQSISELVEQLPQHIRGLASPVSSIILAQELVSGIEGLGKVLRHFGSSFEPDIRDSEVIYQIAERIHIFKTKPKFDSILYLAEDWRLALNSIVSPPTNTSDNQEHDPPIVLVKGGKNTGKSTFSRTLANSLLNSYLQVAFIECDIGQSEFTPGGMVTLNILTRPIFGPPFTHLSMPKRAHFIGGVSPKTSPSHYLSALSDLSQLYQLELRYSTFDDNTTGELGDSLQGKITSSIPLVVNTQGWVKGMGADILYSIEKIFEPSHVVELQNSFTASSSNILSLPEKRLSKHTPFVRATVSSTQISLAAIPPTLYPARFSASDLRNLALLSYFYGRFAEEKPSAISDIFIERWDTSLSLKDLAPIVIDTNKALENITINAPGGEDVIPSELSRALVCGVVGLVVPESPTAHSDSLYLQGGLPSSPQTSQCIGLGFVRGASNTIIQLLTPIPARKLGRCRSLILGELAMPIWAFFDCDEDGQGGVELPFLQWGRSVVESAGGERRRVRRNIMRRSQV